MLYRRVLLKLSGESMAGEAGSGIDPSRLDYYISEIGKVVSSGVSLGIVIGGGNIFRGLEGSSMGTDRVQGDYMGMLATVINGMALEAGLRARGISATLLSGLEISGITCKATRANIQHSFEQSKVVIFSGGTGNPFFTTDTAAALRAAEMEADVLLKGTRVDGVYTSDPEKDPNAERLSALGFGEAIAKGYRILDLTAFTLCQENNIPILVFNINTPGNLLSVLEGGGISTIVHNE